jgi:predicted nucleotidyltransferase
MDARSAPALEDPAGALDRLREQRDLDVPNIFEARDRTAEQLAKVRAALGAGPVENGVSTCVFGSWARQELTEGSDDDWAVVVADPFAAYEQRVTREFVLASEHLGQDERQPGSQPIFGVPFAVDDLVGNIGLDGDTNTNLTRRMLLLLESREVHGSVRDAAIARVLERYLNEGVKPRRVPRFLLNDLVRYWRTICVDFEGKAAESATGEDPKWATRNAKLRTSRKLLFVGGLVSVLLCHHREGIDEMQTFLTRWLDAPPLDRLAAAFLYAAEAEPGVLETGLRTFTAYDRWLALIGTKAVRDELLTITPAGRDASSLFQDIRENGREFEAGLISLLFSPAFEDLTRDNAIF